MQRQHVRNIVLCFALASTVIVIFQNCSNVQFASQLANQNSDLSDTPLKVGVSEVRVGTQNIPPLKLFFVIDNSYTMKENQINLAQSFQNMFSNTNNQSLRKFDTSAYIINTAQRTPAYNSQPLTNIAKLQLPESQLERLTTVQVAQSIRTSQLNTGALAGDILGFQLQAQPLNSFSFLPAFLLGLQEGSSGLVQPVKAIYKAANQDAVAMAAEFQARLELMDATRIPLTNSGEQLFSQILDQESGLCAVARILRNPSSMIQPGEQAAFVIISDEDESDPQGVHCIQSYRQTTLADELIKGRCEERSSVLSYTISQQQPNSCKITYSTGYKFKYSWNQSVTQTDIQYRKLTSPGSYSSPRTQVTYHRTVTTFTATSTSVSFYIQMCSPIIADGIVVGQNCNYSLKSGQIPGDQTGFKCSAAATQINSAAVLNNSQYPVSCQVQTRTVTSCTSGDPNCSQTVSSAQASTVVNGALLTQQQCITAASAITNAIVDGSKPITCVAASPQTGSGACPTSLLSFGCVAQPATYTTAMVTVDGDFTTSLSTCMQKASTLSGNAVDAQNPPTCTRKTTTRLSSNSDTIGFSQTLDGGQTVGDCGSVRSAILAQVQRNNPGVATNGTCQITSYSSGSKSEPVESSGCSAQASRSCSSSSGTLRACQGQLVVGQTTTQTTQLPAVSFEAECTDLCSQFNNTLCAAAAGVVVTEQTTIDQYLRQRYGPTTVCSVNNSAKTISTFRDQPIQSRDRICVGTSSRPQYLVQEGASYFLNELITDYVAGSQKIGTGSYSPLTNLTDYNVSRSQNLFGGTKPFVSVFVRTAEDGAGNGGSVGTTYQNFAQRMEGRVERITSSDYSSSLSSLSGLIQAQLERSFQISEMAPNQSVRKVFMRNADSADWIELDASKWTTSGNSVTIQPTVPMKLDDQLRFQYY